MGGDEVIAGVGCRAGAGADAILAVIARALAGRAATAIATAIFKAREPGLIEAAARLGLPLLAVDDAALAAAQYRCVTRSARVEAATGHASIAEAAAMAAAGPSAALILPRITDGAVTVALAG